MTEADRLADVRARLDRVTDPELDEPVTELGFVTGVSVDDSGRVSIGFRLPTFWCAANFAFMMADDMRRAVSALPWVTQVAVRLDEHMYGDRINDGLSRCLSFQETFAEDADGDLDLLRRTFLVKAFQRRQAALLRALLEQGCTPEDLVRLHLAELPAAARGDVTRHLVDRYLDRRDVPGSCHDPEALAFVDADGAALSADDLQHYVRALERIAINTEFNGAICKGLLAARYDDAPEPFPPEPGLIDFIRQHAREHHSAR